MAEVTFPLPQLLLAELLVIERGLLPDRETGRVLLHAVAVDGGDPMRCCNSSFDFLTCLRERSRGSLDLTNPLFGAGPEGVETV